MYSGVVVGVVMFAFLRIPTTHSNPFVSFLWRKVTTTFPSEKCILYSEVSGVGLVRQRRCCLSFGALRRSRKPIFFQIKNSSKQPSLEPGVGQDWFNFPAKPCPGT